MNNKSKNFPFAVGIATIVGAIAGVVALFLMVTPHRMKMIMVLLIKTVVMLIISKVIIQSSYRGTVIFIMANLWEMEIQKSKSKI